MDNDKKAIDRALSKVLCTPDDLGVISSAQAELEQYIESVRMKAIGWMHAAACKSLDRGEDIRQAEVPELVRQALSDLSAE